MTSRPRSATCSSWVDVISAECSELVVCTMGLTAVIVTLSAIVPTFNWIVPAESDSFGGTITF